MASSVEMGVFNWNCEEALARGSAGLQVVDLREYPHSNREQAYDQCEGREAQLPLCYTLIARLA